MVFEGRNKDYGAYQLRKENPRTTIMALLCAFVLMGVAVAIPGILNYFYPSQEVTAELPTLGSPTLFNYQKPPAHLDPPKPPVNDVKPPVSQPSTTPNLSWTNPVITDDHTSTTTTDVTPSAVPTDNPTGPGGPSTNTTGIPWTTYKY
ncbi:hypothetical protein [Flavobacterium sp. 3HN19-14]|uniref:hypothetical protein n=1 Tax=Flavobacterium sp. 3HN19-14 TaxID=3448133 RepID=UPI003EE1C41D